jgi:AraC family transcriptional regulator
MAYQDILATQTADVAQPDLKDFSAAERLPTAKLGACRSREWVLHVLTLLDKAVRLLQPSEEVAHDELLEATSLLRQQIAPESTQHAADGNGRLLAWQARKVRDYIDRNVKQQIRVADLCALIDRSEAHFSRSFKHTFGASPHAYVIRCRLELAARYMLETDAPLRDIALQCGFTDQAHLCKHFRQVMGETPAAWRRARSTLDAGSAPRTRGPLR